MVRLGLRHAAERPGRSVLAIAVIAGATFILISVDAFRRVGPPAGDRRSGVGGYSLLVDLLLPLAHDPNGTDGRDALGLGAFPDARVDPFRVRPGDDASCLNLYEPRTPTILGASRSFVESGRFTFQGSVPGSEAERANPWLLLDRPMSGDHDPIVPVVADANSMTYVLHKSLGDDVVIDWEGRRLRLRLVAALSDSILQSELVMSEANFLRLFPEQDGFSLLLIEAPDNAAPAWRVPSKKAPAILARTSSRPPSGWRRSTSVENTYISTFQSLGGLGLLLGTIGLAAVLLRNVLERRKELALLGAVGYGRAQVFSVVLAENVMLLVCGPCRRCDMRHRRRGSRSSRSRRLAADRRRWMGAARWRVRGRFGIVDRRDIRSASDAAVERASGGIAVDRGRYTRRGAAGQVGGRRLPTCLTCPTSPRSVP